MIFELFSVFVKVVKKKLDELVGNEIWWANMIYDCKLQNNIKSYRLWIFVSHI